MVPDTAALIVLAAAVGTEHKSDDVPGRPYCHHDEALPEGTLADLLEKHGENSKALQGLLWRRVRSVALRRSNYTPQLDIYKAWREMTVVADLVGRRPLPEPKSWAKEVTK